MHRLSSGDVSADTSVIVDFSLTDNIGLLFELFANRMLVSDFVESELAAADIELPGAKVVRLETEEEWSFLNDLRKMKPGLGTGELGALTVARFRNAILLTNDKSARQTAEELDLPYSGGIGILEFSCEVGKLSGNRAVQLLDDMLAAGARISADLVSTFRQRILGGEP